MAQDILQRFDRAALLQEVIRKGIAKIPWAPYFFEIRFALKDREHSRELIFIHGLVSAKYTSFYDDRGVSTKMRRYDDLTHLHKKMIRIAPFSPARRTKEKL